jgi:ADP-heptose:LPS heptosyltransferase
MPLVCQAAQRHVALHHHGYPALPKNPDHRQGGKSERLVGLVAENDPERREVLGGQAGERGGQLGRPVVGGDEDVDVRLGRLAHGRHVSGYPCLAGEHLPRRWKSMLEIGPVGSRLPNIAQIAVLRGGGLGDLMFAMPAIQSLADAYPGARIVLLGTSQHAQLLAGRPGPVDEVAVLPVARGVYEPAGAQEDPAEQERFFERPFDLAVQVHGGGRWSNPFLRRLKTQWTAGLRTPDAAALDRWLPYRYYQHEMMRALEVVGLVGAVPTALEPKLALTPGDLAAADAALAGLPRPILAVHPGASDPRRCWPGSRFVEVMSAVAGQVSIVVVGTGPESEVAELAAEQGIEVRSLVGRLSMSGLVGVLRRSGVLLANDSGPAHLAHAVGTPTVSIYWMGNVINAAPHGRALHRPHISWTTHCPVCGVPCTRQDVPRCAHDVSFVADVSSADVIADVTELLGCGAIEEGRSR